MRWDMATDIIVAAAIAVLLVFAGLALYQWITRKSLKIIDQELLWMPLPLGLMAIVYFIFEKLIILNVRPNGSGEPSFPSTHTMITATIFFITMLILPKYIQQKPLRIILEILMIVMVILVCLGRVFANMHWPVDVIGAVGFAFIFAEIYLIAIKKSAKKSAKNSTKKPVKKGE